MPVELSVALSSVARLSALAVAVHSVEDLHLHVRHGRDPAWRWSLLRADHRSGPRVVLAGLDLALGGGRFTWILAARLLCALGALFVFHPALQGTLVVCTALIAIRWRGVFNGGSDGMILLVLIALAVASVNTDSAVLVRACLWYIAIQGVCSYFVAGIVKLRNPEWRSGRALALFLRTPGIALDRGDLRHPGRAGALFVLTNVSAVFALSWFVLIFECLFPLMLLFPSLCVPWISAAVTFHLGVFYMFGLNRFVLAWLPVYPALYYCIVL